MNKEKRLKRIAGDFFTEIFQVGRDVGRDIDSRSSRVKNTKLKRTVEFLNQAYVRRKKVQFAKKLKKAGVLPLQS